MVKEFEKIIVGKLAIKKYLFLLILFLLASFLRILYAFQPGIPTAHRTPIYPLFLSGVYFIFGHSYLAVRIMQAIIGALTCLLIYWLGKEIFDEGVGRVVSLIVVFYLVPISYTGFSSNRNLLFTFLLSM